MLRAELLAIALLGLLTITAMHATEPAGQEVEAPATVK